MVLFARCLLAFVLATLPFGASAAAQEVWKGPGWYVTFSDVGGEYDLYSGPYSDRSLCAAVAERLDRQFGSDVYGAACEQVDKAYPTITDKELQAEYGSPPGTGTSAAATPSPGGIDCAWVNDRLCVDVDSIRPSDSDFIGRFTWYSCTTPNVGPPNGKCALEQFQVHCTTGLVYGGEKSDTLDYAGSLAADNADPDSLLKSVCPRFDAVNAKQQRCLDGGSISRPGMKVPLSVGIKDCDELIAAAAAPEDKAKYYWWRGGVYREVKQYDAAVFDYTKAITLDPKPDYYNERGNAYAAQEKWDLAIADSNRAIQLEPKKPLWIGIRGIRNEGAKRYRAALADFDQAISSDPADSFFREQRAALLLKLKRYPDALAEAEKVIAKSPAQAEGYYYRSVAKRALGNSAAADADLAKARAILPKVEEIYSKSIQPDPPPSPAPARKGSKR